MAQVDENGRFIRSGNSEIAKARARARAKANDYYQGGGWDIGASNKRIAEEEARRQAELQRRYNDLMAAREYSRQAPEPTPAPVYRPYIQYSEAMPHDYQQMSGQPDYAYDDYGTVPAEVSRSPIGVNYQHADGSVTPYVIGQYESDNRPARVRLKDAMGNYFGGYNPQGFRLPEIRYEEDNRSAAQRLRDLRK